MTEIDQIIEALDEYDDYLIDNPDDEALLRLRDLALRAAKIAKEGK
jgi:hypothetical protein